MKYRYAALAAATAVYASPFPKPGGVTANISPSAPAPSGCMANWSGTFGIAVQNMTMHANAPMAPVSQISDGQPQASTGSGKMPAMSMYGSSAPAPAPAPTMMTMHPVTQISDGQIQATKPAMSMAAPAPAMTMPAVSQISDGQPQAPTGSMKPAPSAPAPAPAPAVSQISDGQPQAPTGSMKASASPMPAVSQISDGQPQATGMPAPAPAPSMVGCSGPDVLTMTLEGGVLKDSQGRTGYIASNYQFQFDKPAQTGAIYTSGWSVCGNGSLALGGSTTFYQCLSGNFYNLYTENWAPQCSPVTIDMLNLIDCSK